jgi:hypothetical protein
VAIAFGLAAALVAGLAAVVCACAKTGAAASAAAKIMLAARMPKALFIDDLPL